MKITYGILSLASIHGKAQEWMLLTDEYDPKVTEYLTCHSQQQHRLPTNIFCKVSIEVCEHKAWP